MDSVGLRMKVVVAHPSLNRGGGAEKVCLTAVRALVNKHFEVELATLERTDWHFLEGRFGPLCRPTEEMFLVEKLPIKGRLSQLVFTSGFLPFLLFLRMFHKKDVLFNAYGDLGGSIADISYVNSLPFEITRLFTETNLSNSLIWWSIALTYGLSRRVLDRAFRGNRILANSKFIHNALRRHLGIRSQVVYPPVAVEEFRRKKLGSPRKRLVVSVARIRPGKNLNIVPQLAKSVNDAHFVIIGLADSASLDTVQSLESAIRAFEVEHRVTLLINQPRRKLVDILSSSLVFLQTQRHEAFGIAIVEAMAAGCVPLVPKDGGPWLDVLAEKDGQWGYSYSNVEEASQRISMLIQNKRLTKEISNRTVKRATFFATCVFENEISRIVGEVSSEKAA